MIDCGRGDGWFILRTMGRHTLPLTKSLTADGVEAWAPAVMRRLRLPRANVRREVLVPLLPTFVFVRERYVVDMLELAANPERPRRAGGLLPAHREFTVFRHSDRIPIIGDSDLEPLRQCEREAPVVAQQRAFDEGEMVRVPAGSFEGMAGTVVRSDGRDTIVCFGSRTRVKISTFLLEPVRSYTCAEPQQAPPLKRLKRA